MRQQLAALQATDAARKSSSKTMYYLMSGFLGGQIAGTKVQQIASNTADDIALALETIISNKNNMWAL